jgi:hypothetical protein
MIQLASTNGGLVLFLGCTFLVQVAAQNRSELFNYLTALATSGKYYYEPVAPEYYANTSTAEDLIILEYNGTFYEALNNTFYEVTRDSNGTFQLANPGSAGIESASTDGQHLHCTPVYMAA